MATISTWRYQLDQARRRFTPTLNTIPGMTAIERRLLAHEWKTMILAAPPPGSGLKPILGDYGMPILGHMIETFRGGPDFGLHLYQTRGPISFGRLAVLPAVIALGPDATQTVLSTKGKDYSQAGWHPLLGTFFDRGLMLLDFNEHMAHRRIMAEAFTRGRLNGYVQHIDRVVRDVMANQWVADDPRFLIHPAMKQLSLGVAAVVFTGHEHDTDHHLVARITGAFTTTTRAGGAIVRYPIPPFKWWRGLRARTLLEKHFAAQINARRNADGTDMLTVLCHARDDDGNRFTDQDIVNHMIFLMMAAHDTSASTVTTMAYHLAAHPQWQDRACDESARLGDGPLDIESLEKLETLDLVMNESLRMVTPLPFNMRRAVRDTDLLGYYVPAGTNVVTMPAVNHRLPSIWTEPQKFDPDRFAEPRAEHKKHRYAFTPFGGGAHKCIGMTFGQLEVKTVMHRLLRRYRLDLVRPGYQPRWDYAGMPIPLDGMPIVLRPR